MRRVVILGPPGSGKSTVARALGRCLAVPVVHLDQLHFLPGWVLRPKDEVYAEVAKLTAQPEWVMEGNWSHCLDLRLARADAVVYLDLSRPLRLMRVLRRLLLHYGRERPDAAAGCPERFNAAFLIYTWTCHRSTRAKALGAFRDARADAARHHLKSRRDIAAFLEQAGA
ncbi:MAG: hypothetical protein AAF367_08235 [Pseudomonadota bacterium]